MSCSHINAASSSLTSARQWRVCELIRNTPVTAVSQAGAEKVSDTNGTWCQTPLHLSRDVSSKKKCLTPKALVPVVSQAGAGKVSDTNGAWCQTPLPREKCLTPTGLVPAVSQAGAGSIFRLDFMWDGPLPKAGQFFLIKPERSSVFLARPISVAGWSVVPQDRLDGGCTPDSIALRFLIATRGTGTEELAQLRVGERAFLTGPLGNSWWDNELAPQIESSSPIALISGGIGVAPLAAFACELDSAGSAYDFYAGFRSASFGLEDLHPQSLVIATEDGSEGTRGLIPPLLAPQNYRAVYACGPVAMLKAVAVLCKAVSVPCFISMEKHMACGVGACLGCTIKTRMGNGASANRASTNRRCCADGPIFNAEEVVFDE